jgi:predicted secreted hydrolase
VKCFVLIILLIAGVAHGESSSSFTSASPQRKLMFPQDHGTHNDFHTEWWYYTGHLWEKGSTPFNTQFGFQLTFFRSATVGIGVLPIDTPLRQIFFAHAAVTDLLSSTYLSAERYSRGGVGVADAKSDRLDIANHDWSVKTLEDVQHFMFTINNSSTYQFKLEAVSQSPILLHGQAGYSKKGRCPSCASHYYSFPSLKIAGTLKKGAAEIPVEGVAWMDHEFMSSALEEYQVGWDWLCLMFRDGRRLMVARVRSRSGSQDVVFGTFLTKTGDTQSLNARQIKIRELDYWYSTETGARYPISLEVIVPDLNLNEIVVPLLKNQEHLSTDKDVGSYWEGAVETADRDAIGYLELTGYEKDFGRRL